MNTKTPTPTPAKRTPGPWKPEMTSKVVVERAQCRAILSGVSPLMSEFVAFCDGPNMEANAAYICEACNNYERVLAQWEELAEALRLARIVLEREKLLDYCGEDEIVDSDGVKGIGDVIDAALSHIRAGK